MGIINQYTRFSAAMALLGSWIGLLPLRLFLAWEFFDSAMEQLSSGNWFAQYQDSFPFPFNLFTVDFNWQLTLGSELLGALFLLLGFGTRITSLVLMILTLVAWYTVHSGYGYNVCANGYKMALIYLICFIPLLTQGPGRLSLDHWFGARRSNPWAL